MFSLISYPFSGTTQEKSNKTTSIINKKRTHASTDVPVLPSQTPCYVAVGSVLLLSEGS